MLGIHLFVVNFVVIASQTRAEVKQGTADYGGLLKSRHSKSEDASSRFKNDPDINSYTDRKLDTSQRKAEEDSSLSISHEAALIRHILDNMHSFGTLARPVFNSSLPVNVGFRLTLVQILDFDETRQLMVTHAWKSYQWINEVLAWDPDKFGGIQDIRLPPYSMWTPDIVLYNRRVYHWDELKQLEVHQELLAVFNNGTIKWIPSTIYKSSCLIDMTNFPFDQQTCHFKFGSWAYDGLKLNLEFLNNKTSIDWEEYVTSAEWEVLSSSGIREVRHYECCGDQPYPELVYTVTIKRRTAFYAVVLVLPCLLLSCLTLVMFWYPPQRPDRTGLGMSLFSSYFVLLLILVQASPPTAQSISRLGEYYCINMILIAMSTAFSALVINLQQGKDRRLTVPRFFLKINKRELINIFRQAQGMLVQTKYTKDGLQVAPSTSNGPVHMDDTGRVYIDWGSLATVIDRFLFTVFLVSLVLSLVFVFPSNRQ
ncbi:hypothetical protein LSH36_184g12046 [Paralvinella palmiformis]|uniref:Uncharacterized protein n=1 Tax=Paralvinella palmiformis TaxID=53620 RepID=A0AAD9N5T4_9ANNE|nr:hypothetical protein LSH36_184g12046 [Paralvinella palmiformis]